MIYLSLDQAVRITGWAIFEDSELKEYGTFNIKSSKPIEDRLAMFFKELTNLYKKYEFEKIYFEGIQQQHGNVETFKKLAYIQAIVLLWCYYNECGYEILMPTVWRKILKPVLGHGFGKSRAEEKLAARQLIRQKYNLEVTEDEADAICIGLAGYTKNEKRQSAF